MSSDERIVYMDAARSVLITLGVVLHSAKIYASGTAWIVKDDHVAPFFTALVFGIHVFRMPAFFFISGYFCALTLLRFGRGRILQGRMIRLVVPLATVSFLINAPLAIWLAASGYIAIDPRDPTAWISGKLWLFHLWFLANLLIYFLLASLFGEATVRLIRRGMDRIEPGRAGQTLAVVVVLSATLLIYLTVVPVHISGNLYRHIAFFGSYYDLVRYFCPFVLGFAVGADERMATAYFSRGWTAILIWASAHSVVTIAQGPLLVLGEHIAIVSRDLSAAYLTLLLFRSLAIRPSRGVAYAANASYTIYLLHHPLVILIGIALLATSLPVALKFVLVCSGSLILCVLVHHFLVLRSALFGLLLNGRVRHGAPLPVGKSGP